MKMKIILIMVAFLAVLGGTYYFVNLSKSTTTTTTTVKQFVWDFDMDYLQHITLSLPKDNLSESFLKHDDKYFYFDVTDGTKVDMQRWGGGIPLLLSGPGAERLISQDTTDDQLKEYGFDNPNLTAKLTLDDGTVYEVQVGDSNPTLEYYYTRLVGSRNVYTVDKSWYEVISGIVTNPPYVPATFIVEKPTLSSSQISVGGTVIVSTRVTNTGDLSGNYDVNLKINGDIVQTKTVTLAALANQVVTFNVSESTAGSYVVSIDTRTATFVVK